MDTEFILNNIFEVENVLTPTHMKMLTDTVVNTNFPWSFLPNVHDHYSDRGDIVDSFGFIHSLYDADIMQPPTKYWDVCIPPLLAMIDKAGFHFDSLSRARVNLSTKTGDQHFGHPHIDNKAAIKHMYSAIFYLQDSDGPTVFYDMYRDGYKEDQTPDRELKPIKEVHPRKNCGVIFDGNIYHGASNPMEHQTRLIINYNFYGSKL
jgi:hypothetical protein